MVFQKLQCWINNLRKTRVDGTLSDYELSKTHPHFVGGFSGTLKIDATRINMNPLLMPNAGGFTGARTTTKSLTPHQLQVNQIHAICPELIIDCSEDVYHWHFRCTTSEDDTDGFASPVEALAHFTQGMIEDTDESLSSEDEE